MRPTKPSFIQLPHSPSLASPLLPFPFPFPFASLLSLFHALFASPRSLFNARRSARNTLFTSLHSALSFPFPLPFPSASPFPLPITSAFLSRYALLISRLRARNARFCVRRAWARASCCSAASLSRCAAWIACARVAAMEALLKVPEVVAEAAARSMDARRARKAAWGEEDEEENEEEEEEDEDDEEDEEDEESES